MKEAHKDDPSARARRGGVVKTMRGWRRVAVGRRAILSSVLAVTTVALFPSRTFAQATEQADRILVLKSERRLLLMQDDEVLKSFWIALGRRPVGQKIERGDGRTPEGLYRIVGRTKDSLFYRALELSYPNEADKQRARERGVNPGGDILIHAVPDGYEPTGAGVRMIDWTNGCIAVTNADMDEIWDRVADGTWVEIKP